MRSIKILGSLGLVLCLAACADDEGDVDTASAGWRAANLALSDGQQEFDQEIEVGVEGEVTAGCPEGGTVEVQGRMSDAQDFSLTILFAGCQSEGIVVDGELYFAASVQATDSSAQVTFEYVGHLDFSGEVEASCDIDATGRIAAEAMGNEASAEVEFEGHICGVSADTVVKASS